MFVCVKVNILRMLRTLPKIWTFSLNGTSYCWIPKNGYSFKLKNMVQPPNEIDVEGRRDWHYCECEILFGKEFQCYIEGENELQKLCYGSEWYFSTTLLKKDISVEPRLNIQLHESSKASMVPVFEFPNEPEIELELATETSCDGQVVTTCEKLAEASVNIDSNGIPKASKLPFEPEVELQLVTETACERQVATSCKGLNEMAIDNQLNGSSNASKLAIDEGPTEPEVNQQMRAATDCTKRILRVRPTGPMKPASTVPMKSRLGIQLNSTESEVDDELKEYLWNVEQCKLHHLKRPIHYKKFKKMAYPYVHTFNPKDLQPGYKFLTIEEVSAIDRRINLPFCRPGPEEANEHYEWFRADSIVQEVRFKSSTFPFYVVRWVGYEEKFNTVEPLAHVKHTSVHKLFTCPKLYTACGSSNDSVLRRSRKIVLEEVTTQLQMDIEPNLYERTLNRLIKELQVEEASGRYSPEIGFCSYDSVIDAQIAQQHFITNKFILIMNQLHSPVPVHVDESYIGQMFGNLGQVLEFKKMADSCLLNRGTIKHRIYDGLKINKDKDTSPRYVVFFVPRKYGTTENMETVQMSFHMCLFIVRNHAKKNDAIYFDPSTKAYSHGLPKILDDLIDPRFQSFTNKFGTASEKNDCMLQCMQYIIGMAMGEIPFSPDLSEPSTKRGKYQLERAAGNKKMKFE